MLDLNIIKSINKHLLIGPDAYPLELILFFFAWLGFSHIIVVTKNRLSRQK